MTELIPATPENIARAARVIQNGGLVAFPTETVYGLGADAMNAEAVARIFFVKGRPPTDPLIVHLSGLEQVSHVATSMSPLARKLAESFWPGPLTLILPKRSDVPSLVTSGLNTVAVRVPNHPVALSLLHTAGCPIAAPSANRFGHTSPTTAQHVWQDLQGNVDLILDGGETIVGVESTVLDVSTDPPRILRPGGITREALQEVIGTVIVSQQNPIAGESFSSPGLLEKHYAPRAEMILFKGKNARTALLAEVAAMRAKGKKVGALLEDKDAEALAESGATIYRLGSDLATIAHRLYAGMRWLDEQGVDLIVCKDFDETGLGLAIRDRLRRAATRVIERNG
ncbi:MAG TPA: L-threonylcarbamoyladenylate synthase [Anaerolineales bacterium]|nr:L-threonylcarbamoyladenylate synthase [Anaerolineales bacterium]